MKKSVFTYILVLVLTALVLAGLTFGLRSTAQANKQSVQLRMMQALLPGSESFTEEAYTGEDTTIRSVHKGNDGFVIEVATQGYADEITMLVGVRSNGKVTGLVVADMHETAGLGSAALTDWEFLAQFLNTSGDATIGDGVDGLSGATVTSKAVARCVNSAVAYVTGSDVESGATSWGG